MARSLLLLSLVYSYLQTCYAVPWMGAMETPLIGIMATAGMSPRPTEAPNLGGIPKELRPRGNLPNPAPVNWCGLIGGQPTYSFSGGSYLHLCDSTSHFGTSSVEFLSDYFNDDGSTAAATTDLFTNADNTFAADSTSSEPTSSRSTSSSSFSSSDDSDDDNTNTGLASAAIGGIAAGAGLVICAILGFIIWCCLRRRKRARLAASSSSHTMTQNNAPPPVFAPQGPPPMQQPTQPNYQPVPQQDPTQYHGSGQFQPTQAGYYGGPTEPTKDSGAYTHVSPVASPALSNVDPVGARPFSTVSSQPSESTQHLQPTSYYKQPHSPTITEVDGTQGNPGVPHGWNGGGGANEVDGTQGNPGVPYGQRLNSGPYEMH
ncbi:MAG: hypothetical protein Q9195_005746 [Heterodermia aff. obscurata]